MGWLNDILNNVAGVPPTDWTLVENLPDPGVDIGGKPITADECYIELYIESLRLEKARRFATTFNGVVYSFISYARTGKPSMERASITKPQNLSDLDPQNVDRVITVSRRIMGATPWRGAPLGIELGLFSVKSGNLLTPLVNYVTKIADKAGISVVKQIDPFLPLITEGVDLIAGQTDDTVIELAIDTDMDIQQSRICALIAVPRGTLDLSELKIDSGDRKLLYNDQPLGAGYCVFSIRRADRNPAWGDIPDLAAAYEDFRQAVLAGKRKDAEEALAGFNRHLIFCPDLISADKTRLMDKSLADLKLAFPGGGQSDNAAKTRAIFENRVLADLDLYDDAC